MFNFDILDPHFLADLAKITGVDLLLSGDNALVIAMVCAGLAPAHRRIGMMLGVGLAVAMRVGLAFFAAELLAYPFVGLFGGIFLTFVAFKLLTGHDEAESAKPATSLWAAMLAIAVADVGMSTDNVAAVAAIAKGNDVLMALGILISVPCVIFGAAIVTKAVERLPVLLWIGAGFLAWIAGETVAADPVVRPYVSDLPHLAPAAFALLCVLALGSLTKLADRVAYAD